MLGYLIVKLDDLLTEKGEPYTKNILSGYKNSLNADVDKFLREKAIEFSKKGLSKTQLVFASYKDNIEIAGYFTIANKSFSIKTSHKFTNKLRQRINRFALYNPDLKRHILSAPLIAQLGKNSYFPNLITGDELLSLACTEVKKVQQIVGGKFVYLECEDNIKLKDFYTSNGFVEFNKRELEADEESDFKGKYLIQMMDCIIKCDTKK